MKRSGPPRRKQALKVDPEKVKAWERRSRKPIPSRSSKRVRVDRERVKLKKSLMIAAGMRVDGSGDWRRACAGRVLLPEIECGIVTRGRVTLEMHEVVKRSRWRKGLTVRSNCVLLCQAHHDYTETAEGIVRATEVGLLKRAEHVHPFDKFDSPEEGTKT
jgi:hypothetical protein